MTDWCRSKSELRVWGNASIPCCGFTLLTKSNPQPLQVWVSHLPGINNNFQVWWGMHSVDSCMFNCVEAEKWQKFHHAIMCLCILSPESILHFLSCPLQSLCFISSLPMENSAVFHTRLLQALQNPSLPCKGSAAFQWGFKQLHQLLVSHHKTPFSLLKASLKHFMCLHFQSPDLMEKEGGKALL